MNEDPTETLTSSDSEKLTRIFDTVQSLDLRLGSLERTVVSLEQKVEERLYDTRPIWEEVGTDIVQLQAGQQRLEEGQKGVLEGQEFLRDESRDVRTDLRELLRKLSIVNDTLVTMQTDYRDIYDRIREIERQR